MNPSLVQKTLRVLWWGRFDPDYSRNRILRQLLTDLGCTVSDFQPQFSRFGDCEARLKGVVRPDLIWVPCFRQRDMAAALRWGKKRAVPVVFDPLISAYDKQVLERKKILENSVKAKRLLAWESDLFRRADLVLADTGEHAGFFAETFAVDEPKIAVAPVGAEEALFQPAREEKPASGSPLSVLFFGSFLDLQGPEFIAQAAVLYKGPAVNWTMAGEGPQLKRCQKISANLSNVKFLPWVAYEKLPQMIQNADVLLGVFGTTAKAKRVIPNKVYQALACGKPLLTMPSPAYPQSLVEAADNGIRWVAPGDPEALATVVAELAEKPDALIDMGRRARQTYEEYFSMTIISQVLEDALKQFYAVKENS